MKNAWLFQFENVDSLQNAIQNLKNESRVRFEAYSAHDLVSGDEAEANQGWNKVKLAAFLGALSGLFLAIFGQWYANVIDMPLNIGGRPLNSWPAFIPVAWVFTVLCTAISTFVAFLVQAKLPSPHDPVFEFESYDLSQNFYSIFIFSDREEDLPENFILELGQSLGSKRWEKIP